MEYKFFEMAKSLVSRIGAVAIVISVLAGGQAHADVPSCLLPPHVTSTLNSGIDHSATAKIAKGSNEVGGTVMGHITTDNGGQNKFQCCDNWCPLLFVISGQGTTSSLKFRSVHRLVPQGSILTAYGGGLERPPKNFFTY